MRYRRWRMIMSLFPSFKCSDGARDRSPTCCATLGSRGAFPRSELGVVDRALVPVELDESRRAAVPACEAAGCTTLRVPFRRGRDIRSRLVPATLVRSPPYRL